MAFQFKSSLVIPAPLEEVFEFFSQAENLQSLTPPQLQFQILTPLPIEMRPGALIDYRLKLFGIPFMWQTEITEFVPLSYFCDVQKKGPYKKWEHRHEFFAQGEHTRMEDTVDYDMLLGPIVNPVFVSRQVNAIFQYRTAALEKHFKADFRGSTARS